MSTPREVACQRFRDETERFQAAAQVMAEDVLPRLRRQLHMPHCLLSARAKDVGSFVKKTWLPKYRDSDPWETVRDKVGARVVVPNVSDLRKVIGGLQEGLAGLTLLSEFDDKTSALGTEQIGYQGVHVQVGVPGVALLDGSSVECELQIRTGAMDLWAATSHSLAYKPTGDVNSAIERRINRLSVLTEIFDEAVERTVDELAETPDYDLSRLLNRSEQLFLRFSDESGNQELSIEVLRDLADLFAGRVDETLVLLGDVAEAKQAKLQAIYADYGPGSDIAESSRYWMFTQPESLILFALMTARYEAVHAAAQRSVFASTLEPLFESWGS